jgi:putative spermidine/putrescine transport system permease protein
MSTATLPAANTAGHERSSGAPLALTLLLPLTLINAVVFIAPMAYLLRMSLNRALDGGGIEPALTFANYLAFLTDSFYLEMILRSVLVSAGVTVLTLLLSYPIALFIHRAPPRWRNLLTVITISPLLVSAVVRTYGWMLILSDQGIINGTLVKLGIITAPLRLINNMTGVVIGLVEILMPYMILALMAGFGRLDRSYEEAAQTLGARPFTVFRRIIVPVTAPGIALGCLLCFVLAISSFVTPKLLGGGRVFLLATEIFDQAINLLNWPLAGTMSLIVLVLFGLALGLYGAIARQLGTGEA